MIGLTWMAGQILVLVIFILLCVLHTFWGPRVRQMVQKFLAKTLLKGSLKKRRDLLKARPVEENSPKNNDPSDVIEPRVGNPLTDFKND